MKQPSAGLGHIIELFRCAADYYCGTESFIFGDDRRYSDAQNSKVTYPLLALEIPTITRKKRADSKLYYKTYKTQFSIVSNTDKDDYVLQDHLLIQHDQDIDAILDLIENGFSDANRPKKNKPIIPMGCSIVFGGSFPICQYESNNEYGWIQEIEFTTSSFCREDCNFTKPHPACCDLTSDFTFVSDGEKITITDASSGNDATKNEWKYRDHCGHWKTSTGTESLVIPISHNYYEVTLKTQDPSCSCCKYSKFIIRCSKKPFCGRAYPFRLFDTEGGPAQINPGEFDSK